jgi:hypothetical protein
MPVAVGGGAEFAGELEHALKMRVVEVGGRGEQALALGAGMLDGLHGFAPRAIQERDGRTHARAIGSAALHDPNQRLDSSFGVIAREILRTAE